MQALRLLEWKHGPTFEEVPEPDPGPGQVLVRIGGAGACHSDLHLMYEFEAGALPGGHRSHSGTRTQAGSKRSGAGVAHLEVGEPVAIYGPWGCGRCHRCVQGMENYCMHQAEIPVMGGGLGADGGMAPLMLVPNARHLVPLGDLDPVAAAPLTDAGLTPYHAIKRSLPLLVPDSTAVVIGAGGLGHMAVQILARALAGDHRCDRPLPGRTRTGANGRCRPRSALRGGRGRGGPRHHRRRGRRSRPRPRRQRRNAADSARPRRGCWVT